MKPPIGPHSSPSQAQAQTPTPHTPDSQLILCAACGASSDKKVQFHRFFYTCLLRLTHFSSGSLTGLLANTKFYYTVQIPATISVITGDFLPHVALTPG